MEVESTINSDSKVEGGFDFKVIKATTSGNYAESRTRRLSASSPTDTGINRILNDSNLTVVLDELHRSSEALRQQLADWIKSARASTGNFTLVRVGISTDAGRLVSLDPGIDRYIKEMRVELLSENEATSIITEGFQKLDLSISDPIVNRLVSAAAGAPTIAHSLCLDAAESAIGRQSDEVEFEDLKSAVQDYLKEHGGRLSDHYYRTVETVGSKRYRKQILQAVANSSTDYATMEDIKISDSEALDEEVPFSSLSDPLRDLKKKEYGAILKDVEREI